MSKFRREGYMEPLSKQSIPRDWLFYDTETYIRQIDENTKDLPFRLGVAIYCQFDNEYRSMKRKVYKFKSTHEFLELLDYHTRKKSVLNVIAHNQAFDVRILNLPRAFTAEGLEHDMPIINDRTFIWSVKGDNGKMLFLDTANFGVNSVEELGVDMGYPKLEVDFDSVSEDELFVYCERDCEILETFIRKYVQFINDNQLGAFKVTIASQALATYRTVFMDKPPYIHRFWHISDLEREAYHGGRSEAFYIGKLNSEKYYYLDINSMYPYVMTNDKLPRKIVGYTENVSPAFMPIRLAKYYVIADVTYVTDKPFSCVKENNKLLFKTGYLRSVLHQPELEYLIDNGHILEVHRCAVYTHAPIFKSYVTFMNRQKEQATLSNDKSWRYIAKLFGNTLYGKFGQLRPRREFLRDDEPGTFWRMRNISATTGEHSMEICWDGKVYMEFKKGETALSIPAIAGSITAYARMMIWKYLELAGLENCFYTDTDSLIVNEEGYKRLLKYVDKAKLGMLKLEGITENVEIYGAKDYVFDNMIKVKGVPKKAVTLEPGVWEYEQFQGYLTWLNAGAKDNVTVKKMIKHRSGNYDKGIVSDSGRVTPYHVTNPNLAAD